MTTERHNLFDAHVESLRKVCPDADSVFVCPICLRVFPSDGIARDEMDVGHVWPELIRSNSEVARMHKVLLCKRCNSNAGARGDAVMQEVEQFRISQMTREPYKKQRVKVMPPSNVEGKPLNLHAFVKLVPPNQVHVLFEKQRNKKQQEYYENAHKQLRSYFAQGIPTVYIKPKWPDPTLASIGWLTSAYLLSFYMFGYQYILQRILDPVRKLITDSFDRIAQNLPEFRYDADMAVAIWDERQFADPQIGFFAPFDEIIPSHIQVNFHYVHVRLPVRGVYSIEWKQPPDPKELPGELFMCNIDQPLHKEADDWEGFFPAPDYFVQGSILTNRDGKVM